MASANDSKWQKDAADQNFDYMFKLLIIGNSSVGKTSFLFRYADDSFTSAFVSTVGIDFKVKTVFRQDKRVKLQIWVSYCCIFRDHDDNVTLSGFEMRRGTSFPNLHDKLKVLIVHAVLCFMINRRNAKIKKVVYSHDNPFIYQLINFEKFSNKLIIHVQPPLVLCTKHAKVGLHPPFVVISVKITDLKPYNIFLLKTNKTYSERETLPPPTLWNSTETFLAEITAGMIRTPNLR